MMKVKTYEEMKELTSLLYDERMDDVLSLYDAQERYGISRSALREAALLGKIESYWLGGVIKKSLYIFRKDIIKYLLLPQSKSKSKRMLPWRMLDKT